MSRIAMVAFTLLFGMPLVAQDTNTGLVGWWRFEEGSGSLASDSSGAGNHMRYVTTESPVWTNGRFGSGVYFHGINSNQTPTNILMFSNVTAFDYGIMKTGCETSNWTLSAWIWSDNVQTGSERGIIGRPGGHYGIMAYSNSLTSQSVNFKYVNGLSATSNIPFQYGFNDSQWHMVTVVFSNRTFYSYYDGQPVLSWSMPVTENFNMTSTSLSIGGFNNNQYNFPFRGIIDEVRVYNRALIPGDVRFLYKAPPVSVAMNGRIVTPDGFPIAGATVAISNNYWNGGGRYTGADGRFNMEVGASSNLTITLVPPPNVNLSATVTNITAPTNNFTFEWTNAISSASASFSVTAPGQFFTSKGNPFSLVINKTNAGTERVLVRAIRANAGDTFALFAQAASSKTVLVQVPASEIRRLLNTGAYIIETRVIPQGRSDSDLDIPAIRKLVIIAQ